MKDRVRTDHGRCWRLFWPGYSINHNYLSQTMSLVQKIGKNQSDKGLKYIPIYRIGRNDPFLITLKHIHKYIYID